MPTRRSSTAGRTNSIVRNALKTLYLFLIPAFLLVLVFNYVPMVGLIMAFQNYQANLGWFGSEFVGLTHFVEFLQDPTFWTVLKNTLVISVSLMIFSFPAPILLAICLDNIPSQGFKRAVQTISYLPHFVSWVVMAGLVYRILDTDTGIVNYIIRSLKYSTCAEKELSWSSESLLTRA